MGAELGREGAAAFGVDVREDDAGTILGKGEGVLSAQQTSGAVVKSRSAVKSEKVVQHEICRSKEIQLIGSLLQCRCRPPARVA